jgi:hypothetical protein
VDEKVGLERSRNRLKLKRALREIEAVREIVGRRISISERRQAKR